MIYINHHLCCRHSHFISTIILQDTQCCRSYFISKIRLSQHPSATQIISHGFKTPKLGMKKKKNLGDFSKQNLLVDEIQGRDSRLWILCHHPGSSLRHSLGTQPQERQL